MLATEIRHAAARGNGVFASHGARGLETQSLLLDGAPCTQSTLSVLGTRERVSHVIHFEVADRRAVSRVRDLIFADPRRVLNPLRGEGLPSPPPPFRPGRPHFSTPPPNDTLRGLSVL